MRTFLPHLHGDVQDAAVTAAADLLAALPDPFLAVDGEGRVLHANPAAVELLGRGECLLGRIPWDGVDDPGLTAVAGLAHRTSRGGRPGTAEVELPGTGRWFQVQAFPAGDGTGLRFADITVRRDAERRAQEALSRTAALIDNMSAGMVVTDLDGVAIEANARFLEITGLTRDEVIGSRRPHPWWVSAHSREYERLLDARAMWNRVSHIETVLRARSGREFPARVGVSPLRGPDGEPIAVIKTVSDITEEHRARQMLRRSEAEFRLLAEHSADLICRHDRDARMLYVSPASRAVLGQTPFAARGRRLDGFVHPDDREAMAAAFRDVLTDGRDRTVVVRGRRRAGERVWLETTVRRVSDAPEGEQLISATRDVTTRHLAQLESAAITRISDAVAAGAAVPAVAAVIAQEAARLLDMDASVLWRFDDTEAVAVAAWGLGGSRPGGRVPLPPARPGDEPDLVGRADPVAALMRVNGCRTTLAAPVVVGGRLWGSLLVGMRAEAELSDQLEAALARLAELTSTTIARAEASAELTARAERDALTGVANRAVFDDRIADAAAAGRRVALCLVDLDHFKGVNDTHGHDAGDEVLRRVAGRLQESARRGDLVARVGGEEFAWLMFDTSLEDAVRAAERARMLIAGTVIDPVGGVTVSAGISVADGGPWDAMELFRTTDRALYAAKRSGRDRVVGLPG